MPCCAFLCSLSSRGKKVEILLYYAVMSESLRIVFSLPVGMCVWVLAAWVNAERERA